jgi:hypothetical protein
MLTIQFTDYIKKLQEGKIPPQFLKGKDAKDSKDKDPDKDGDNDKEADKDTDKDEDEKDDKKPKGKFPFSKKDKEDKDDKKDKDLKESLSTDDMYDALQNASGTDDKFDQAIWSWFEDNMADSKLYPGDATPDEYLDAMSDAQIKKCYTEMSKHFKKQLSESYAYTHTWTKDELLEFISELEDDEVQEVGDFLMGELMEEDEFEDDDFETGSDDEDEDELKEGHFFKKNKSVIDREKRKNVAQRKMKAKLLKKYYKKNKSAIARKAKIYRKKAKKHPNSVFHHKGVV